MVATGAKGVLADYADAKHKMELLNAQQKEEAWRKVYKYASCSVFSLALFPLCVLNVVFVWRRESFSAATADEQREMVAQAEAAKEALLSSDEVSDDDDDEFMRDYRQKRLAELKAEQVARMRSAYRPTFGSLLTMTPDALAESVDDEHPDTFVIVHLQDAALPACIKLNAILHNLARKLPMNKFVKMTAADVSDAMTVETLPTVVV